jgi:hypothetical protein
MDRGAGTTVALCRRQGPAQPLAERRPHRGATSLGSLVSKRRRPLLVLPCWRREGMTNTGVKHITVDAHRLIVTVQVFRNLCVLCDLCGECRSDG